MEIRTLDHLEALLATLTVQEKLGQLNQLYGIKKCDPALIREGKVGSFLLEGATHSIGTGKAGAWADEVNRVQRLAVEESRLGIPLLIARDIIHGYRTVFPIPLGMAASFNPEVTERCGRVAAREATAEGIRWNYSPMLDVGRDARWGRIAEGYGEDPCLASRLGAALVCGYQGSKGFDEPTALAACAKHFVAYGAAEAGIEYGAVDISEATLREIYLPPFKAAIDAGVASVMPAFNEISGRPMSASRWLLTEVLRGEYGFEGVSVSDWCAVKELVQHRVAATESEAALAALLAGIDVDLVSSLYLNELEQHLTSGRLAMADLDRAVRRVLQLKFKLGLFANPYADPARPPLEILSADNRHEAFLAACQAMVLLKNERDLLPLRAEQYKAIALAGPFAEAQAEMLGCWAIDGVGEDVVPLSAALREALPQETMLRVAPRLSDHALAEALLSDLVIVALGEHPNRSGEAGSVTSLELPPGQIELVRALSTLEIPIVAVVFAGRPLVLTELERLADAVLFVFHPGIEGGRAVAATLTGANNPSGKLPISFPRATGQAPIYYNRKPTGRPEQRYDRFTSRYVDQWSTPLHPFGFGLSYSAFEYTDLQLSSPAMTPSESLTVHVTVHNSSDRDGWEIVQLYVSDLVRSVTPPVRELKDFRRVHLAAGERCMVTFELPASHLAYWREGAGWTIEDGEFAMQVGGSSASGLTARFTVRSGGAA